MKIAIAGGTGQVAQEVIDALAETQRHELLILSRSANEKVLSVSDVVHRAVAYHDKSDLIEALRDVHTVLSFIQILSDENQTSQKFLIDAAIQAGVKRFAPSEYGSRGLEHMSWWNGKNEVRRYLAEINREEIVLEYTLFQPGLFLEYLAFPYKTARHLQPLQTIFDLEKSRAIIVRGHEDAVMTLTSVTDLAAMVVKAVEFRGRWPTTIGIQGNKLTFHEIIGIGERIRGLGQPFDVERVEISDLRVGRLKTSWTLETRHAAVPIDEAKKMQEQVAIGVLLSCVGNAWDISDDANRMFPEHAFVKAEDYLAAVWSNKA